VIVLVCAGANIKHFMYMVLPVTGIFALLITFIEYMRKRVFSFLDPFADKLGSGYQVVQSLYAIGSGGFWGRGFGKSIQKFFYIPEAHNDFIFSIYAEEFGYFGVIVLLTLFLVFVWRGLSVAVKAPDKFGCLIALGITSLVAVQTIMNIAVVTSSMPPTGVGLPFFSYGGTSLVMFMFSIGIVLNISKQSIGIKQHQKIT
jgi:cell division protein FtsW